VANREVTGPHGTYELIVTKALERPTWKQNATFGPGPEFGAPEYGETPRVDDQIRLRNAERRSFSVALINYVMDLLGTAWTNRHATGVRICEADVWSV
jgi:hypothetical protein